MADAKPESLTQRDMLIDFLSREANNASRALEKAKTEISELRKKVYSRDNFADDVGRQDTFIDDKILMIAARAARARDLAARSKRRSPLLPGTRAASREYDLADEARLRSSKIFDANWYSRLYPDVKGSGLDPASHYARYGFAEGRWPNALFDSKFYLRSNLDVLERGVNPLLHYETIGWKEFRNPNAFFDVKFYLAANADVAAAGIEPLLHYLIAGYREQRETTAVFSTKDYVEANKHLSFENANVLAHFLHG